MEINQAAQMIEWLDEERRHDKAVIATLQERLAQQQEAMDTLMKRINAMESDQTVLRSQFIPSGRDTEMMDQLRKEMLAMVESIEAKRLTAEREAERRADIAREAVSRPVRELTEKIARLERQTTELPAITSEKDRLSSNVSTLQQRIDDITKRSEEPDRRITYIEEQRRQDSRRLSELESEIPEVRKQIDTVKPKLTLLEDLVLRSERKIQEVQNGDRDRREQIQQFIDQQTLLLQGRDLQVQDLLKRFGDQDNVMQRNLERFETWQEAYRDMRRIIDDFDRIGERLERRINEVAEMQRLSEERFRQEWNDWGADEQKRWKNYTLSNDEVWRNHDQTYEKFIAKFGDLESLIPPLQDSINRIWNLERERAQLYRERYQTLLHEHDTSPSLPTVTGTGTIPRVTTPSISATGTYPAVGSGSTSGTNGSNNGASSVP